MLGRVIPWQLIGAVAFALVSIIAVVWLRLDAVDDFKNELNAERAQHTETAREIENETRRDNDGSLADCLRGAGC